MTEKRFLEFVHRTSGQIGARVDVTGKLDETVMKRVRAMLRNTGTCWYVRDTRDGFRHLPPPRKDSVHAPQ